MIKSYKENLVLFFCIFVVLVIAFYPFHYGYFCDELYYIALSKNLAFGYIDVPPLMPFCMAIIQYVFGESLFAIHILPALIGIGIVILIVAKITTQKIGGGMLTSSKGKR